MGRDNYEKSCVIKLNEQPVCGIQATSLIHTRNSVVNQNTASFISTFCMILEVVLTLRIKIQHPVMKR